MARIWNKNSILCTVHRHMPSKLTVRNWQLAKLLATKKIFMKHRTDARKILMKMKFRTEAMKITLKQRNEVMKIPMKPRTDVMVLQSTCFISPINIPSTYLYVGFELGSTVTWIFISSVFLLTMSNNTCLNYIRKGSKKDTKVPFVVGHMLENYSIES